MIASTVDIMRSRNDYLPSAQLVLDQIQLENNKKVTLQLCRRVMKEEMGLRFKKITHLAQGINYDANLIKRHQFAKIMIRQLISGLTIINVDETWLG